MEMLRRDRFSSPHQWKIKKLGELKSMGDVAKFFDDNSDTVRGAKSMGIDAIRIDGKDRWRNIT